MTRRRIIELLDELPENSFYAKNISPIMAPPGSRGPRNISPALLDCAVFDTKFIWRFTRSFVEANLPLPASATREKWMCRAWTYGLDKMHDPVMTQAVAIEGTEHRLKRNLIKALLLIRDKPMGDIARKVGLGVEVIEAFEALFWNVRDRMDEEDYITRLVFPEGIQTEFRPDYIIQEDLGQLMLKAAILGGERDVFALARMRSDEPLAPYSAGEAAQELESAIMANALVLARLGLLNQPNLPGLDHARSVIVASKKAGMSVKSDDDVMGLGALGMAHAIARDIAALQSEDLRWRNFARSKIAEKDAKAGGKLVSGPV